MTELTYAQRQWLEAEGRNLNEAFQFLTNGEPGFCPLIDTTTFKRSFAPTLRSMPVKDGDTPHRFDTEDEALERAKAIKEKWQADLAKEHREPLDEVALGIDGRPAVQMEQAEDALMRIGTVIHIGNAMATDQFEAPYDDPIEDLIDFLESGPGQKRHNSTDPLFAGWAGENDDPFDISGGIESDQDLDLEEFLIESIRDAGVFGVAMQVSCPVVTHGERSRSYSWGHCRLGWVYGETFDKAHDAAIDWARQHTTGGS